MPRGMLRWHLRNRLAFIRETRGMTQAALAKQARVSTSQIARWETDRTLPPDDAIRRLAQALQCQPHDIFPFE